LAVPEAVRFTLPLARAAGSAAEIVYFLAGVYPSVTLTYCADREGVIEP